MSRSLLPVTILGAAIALAFHAGCSSTDESLTSSSGAATQAPFDRNNILDDASMTDTSSMTTAQVQAFLEKTPYKKRSVLADYRPKGKAASAIIVETATTYGLNPMVLLVRIQVEQGLISQTTTTGTAALDKAFGCGCSDGAECIATFQGFENQARCAGKVLSTALKDLASSGRTNTGWGKNVPKSTVDKLSVTPKNAATAALYTYTPWVGKLGGGNPNAAGTSAHWQIWNAFVGAADAPPPPDDAGVVDPSAPDPSGQASPGTSAGYACDDATCGAGRICDVSGACVAGCRMLNGVDTCPNGARCSASDGLVGTCRVQSCGSCAAGMFCDNLSASPQCVECTNADTSNCRAEVQGQICKSNGRCGCRTSADCGFDRQRICDPISNTCMADPFGTAVSARDAGAAETPQPTETTTPAPVPELPPSNAPSSSSASGSTPDTSVDVPPPAKAPKGGCSTTPGSGGAGSALATLAMALGMVLRRRRKA